MLRKFFFTSAASILVLLAWTTASDAYYAYHYSYNRGGGGYGGYHYGYHYGGYGGGYSYGYRRVW